MRDDGRAWDHTASRVPRRARVPLLQRRMQDQVRGRSGGVQYGRAAVRGHARGHRVHVSHASRRPPDRTWHLPDLWHGARTGADHGRAGGRRGVARYDAPPGYQRRVHAAGVRHRHGRPDSWSSAAGAGIAYGLRLDRAIFGHAGRPLWCLAFLRSRCAVTGQPQPEHVHPDQSRGGGGVRVLGTRRPAAGHFSAVVSRERGGRALLRGCCRHHHAGPGGPGDGAPRAQPDRCRHTCLVGPGAHDGPPHRGRRHRKRRASGACAARRQASRAPWRESASRRRCARGLQQHRRVDDYRRAAAGGQAGRRSGNRRNGERHGWAGDPGRESRRRHVARTHRADGGRGPAQSCSDSEARGPGSGVLCSRRDPDCHRDLRDLGAGRARTAARYSACQRRRRADHRLPVRAGAGHPDVHHGGDRQRRAVGRALQECRSHRGHVPGRHADHRQDRHADRGPSRVGRCRVLRRAGRRGTADACCLARAGE